MQEKMPEERIAEELPPEERPARVSEPPRAAAEPRRRGYRSLFWPLVLIGVGVLWLMGSLGIIGPENLSVLIRIWPLALVVIGLDILLGRSSPLIGGLLGLLAVGAAVVLVIIGPSLGLAADAQDIPGIRFGEIAEIKHGVFHADLDGAQSAEMTLNLSVAQTRISELESGSDQLVVADVDYLGDFWLNDSGSRSRQIEIDNDFATGPLGVPMINLAEMDWDIRLNRDVPLDLTIDGGLGQTDIDLSQLTLTDLTVEGGAGSIMLAVPAAPSSYDADLNVGPGRFDLSVADGAAARFTVEGGPGTFEMVVGSGADITLDAGVSAGSFAIDLGSGTAAEIDLEGGPGSIRITVPRDAAVRLEVKDDGPGSINIAGDLHMIDDYGDDNSDTGIWETDGYDRAAAQVSIVISSMGPGSLVIRR